MPPSPRIFSYAIFNLPALVKHAELLRSARCTCDDSQEPMSGSHNWAILLTFDDDGEDWIFRSPRQDNGFSEQTTTKIIESEVASIKVSKLNGLPVVEIKSHCGSRANEIGIPFILATRAPGFSISSKFVWDPYPEGMKKPRYPLPCLPRVAKEKIMRQLGMMIAKILHQPFDQIGSVREREGEIYIEECLSRALTWSSRDSFNDIARGPFSNEQDYYESIISALCHHAGKLPLDHHLFLAPVPKFNEFQTLSCYRSAVQSWNNFVTVGSKIDSSKNRLDYLTAANLLRNIVPSITTNQQKYYLKPPDLSVSNIFIDDDFNITCIIDWASCFTVPLPTLLMTPGLPHPRDDVDKVMTSIFKESVTVHSPQLKEALEDPLLWEIAKNSRLFMQLIDLDDLQDYPRFVELYTSVYTDMSETHVRRLFNDLREDDIFIGQAKTLLEEDLPATEIQRREEEYFAHSRPGAETLARKTSEMAASDREFVADSKFWKSQAAKELI